MNFIEKIPLCVPYWDEKEALSEGAEYNSEYGFYIQDTAFIDNCWKWLPRQFNPDAPKPVLIPDMLPVTTWEKNIRNEMGTELWDRIRRHAYKAAGYRCEICGTKGKMEAHELWELENETQIQRLTKILALCPLCHKAHHLGIAKRLGILYDVKMHMKKVNNWSDLELNNAITDAYETWEQRSHWNWSVDLSFIQKSGYLYV